MRAVWTSLAMLVCSGSVGCGTLYQMPAANAPMFNSAGELHLSAHLSSPMRQWANASLPSLELQAAFSPVEHFGLFASATTNPYRRARAAGQYPCGYWDDDDYLFGEELRLDGRAWPEYLGRNYGELAFGAYHTFAGVFHLEAFAGAGLGEYWGLLDEDGRNCTFGEADYARGFVQIDLGPSFRVVELGGTVRLGLVHGRYVASGGPIEFNTGFFEGVFFIRFKVLGELLTPELQIGAAVPFHESPHYDLYWTGMLHFHVSVGLRMQFDLW